jgi:hypothetical protein
VDLLTDRKEIIVDADLESCILMACSALSIFRYFVFIAAYLENAVSHSYIDGNGSSFFTVTLEKCGNPSFRPAQKLIRGTYVYLAFKPVSVEMSVYSSYYFVNNPCFVNGNINGFRNT